MPRRTDETRTDRNDASRMHRERFRKKLDGLLGAADDEAFFNLVWMVDALQSGRDALVRDRLDFPPAALTRTLGDPAYIPRWDLETVLGERLGLPPFQPPAPNTRKRYLNCTAYVALSQVVAISRDLENAEMGLILRRMNVLEEMRRISHRQFEWQRGFINGPQLYRWPFLYGGPEAQAYFLDRHKISMPEFVRFGVTLYNRFGHIPVWARQPGAPLPGFDLARTEAALRLLATPIERARAHTRELRGPALSAAYQPSHLRGAPITTFADGRRLRAPIRELLLARVTAGLYYDLAGAPGRVRNEAARRFEVYTHDLLAASYPGFDVSFAPTYRWRGQPVEGPDVLLSHAGQLVAAFENKARKMSYRARFAEDPLANGETGLSELADGVFQLWKFFSHARRGLISGVKVSEASVGVLITLDNWMTMSRTFQDIVLDDAARLATQRDPEISPVDRRTVVFASVEDLEATIERSNESLFAANLRAATEERFTGWMLPNIHEDIDTGVFNDFALAHRVGEVLPWLAEALANHLEQAGRTKSTKAEDV